MKKLVFIIIFLLHLAASAGDRNIAVISNTESESFNRIIEDIKKHLKGDGYEVFSMLSTLSGSSILKRLENLSCKLILAFGESATEAALTCGMPVLILFNPKLEEVLANNPNPNAYGISVCVDPDFEFSILSKIFPPNSLAGLIYDPKIIKHHAELIMKKKLPMQIYEYIITSKDDILPAFNEAIKKGVKLFYLLPDKTIINPAIFPNLLKMSVTNKIPLIGLSEPMTKAGCIISFHFTNETLAEQTAAIIRDIMAGKTFSSRIFYPECIYSVNKKIAEEVMKISIPAEVLKKAKEIS